MIFIHFGVSCATALTFVRPINIDTIAAVYLSTPAESTRTTHTQTHLFRLILFMDVLSAANSNKIML